MDVESFEFPDLCNRLKAICNQLQSHNLSF